MRKNLLINPWNRFLTPCPRTLSDNNNIIMSPPLKPWKREQASPTNMFGNTNTSSQHQSSKHILLRSTTQEQAASVRYGPSRTVVPRDVFHRRGLPRQVSPVNVWPQKESQNVSSKHVWLRTMSQSPATESQYDTYDKFSPKNVSVGRTTSSKIVSSRRASPKQHVSCIISPGRSSTRHMPLDCSVKKSILKQETSQKYSALKCASSCQSLSQSCTSRRQVVQEDASPSSASSPRHVSPDVFFCGDATWRLVSPGMVACVMRCHEQGQEDQAPATYTTWTTWGIKVDFIISSLPPNMMI